MEVTSLSSLRVASVRWQPSAGAWAMTIVCKATYRLLPGTAQLAGEQLAPSEEDRHWDGDPRRSLHAPLDLVPSKARADVMLVGHAYAPRAEPVRSLTVRMCVGTIDKSIAVLGDRGGRFVMMPLRWERAAGGPGTSNPVGVTDGRPNLQPKKTSGAGTRAIEPIGFGPIASTWPERRALLGPHADAWTPSALRECPLPPGLDRAYFNAAPCDQQIDELGGDEEIHLENLSREHPRLVTRLPGARPRALVERPGIEPVELPMVCDTLWMETDRGIATLTWRAWLSLRDPDEAGRVVIALEESGRPIEMHEVVRRPDASAPTARADGEPRPGIAAGRLDSPTVDVGSGDVEAAARPAIDLVWFDPETTIALRDEDNWSEILEAVPADAEGEREVHDVLARGAPIDPDAIEDRFRAAVHAGGRFVPPLVLVAGELVVSFDEIERLRALVATVRPMAAVDPELGVALEGVRGLLDATSAALVLAHDRVQQLDAVVAQSRALEGLPVDAVVQRALLEGRCYQRRSVLGGACIRAHMEVAGGPPLPVYLPDAIAARLPLFHRFAARALARVHPSQDELEPHACALHVFGLARAVALPRA